MSYVTAEGVEVKACQAVEESFAEGAQIAGQTGKEALGTAGKEEIEAAAVGGIPSSVAKSLKMFGIFRSLPVIFPLSTVRHLYGEIPL